MVIKWWSSVLELFGIVVCSLYRQAILRKWKELKGADATYGKLLRLCCEHDIQSIAKAICDMLRSRVYGKLVY